MSQALAAVAALNYTALTRIDFDKPYQPGDVLTLTQEQAKPLIDIGAIELVDGGTQVLGAVDASDLGDGVQQLVEMNALLEGEKNTALQQLEQAQQAHSELSAAYTALQAEHHALSEAHAEMLSTHAAVVQERDALQATHAEAPAAAKATAGGKSGSKG